MILFLRFLFLRFFLCFFLFLLLVIVFLFDITFRFFWEWVTSMVGTLLLFRFLEIDVTLFLAFFVIETRSDLRTLLRFTIRVFETPVADLKVTSLCIGLLLIRVLGVVVLMHLVDWHALADMLEGVGDFAGVQ